MRDVRYKCGRSDFAVTGIISNLRRALTSRSGRQPLKVNLDLASDTVDINQLAQALFAGSAYHLKRAEIDDGFDLGSENLDDESLDRRIGDHVQDAPDSMAPLLIHRGVAGYKCRQRHLLGHHAAQDARTGHHLQRRA